LNNASILSTNQSQLLCNKDEEKESILRNDSSATEDNEENDDVYDLQSEYNQQQQRLRQEEMKLRQLTQEVEKSVLISKNDLLKYQKFNGKARPGYAQSAADTVKQQEYERIITENQSTLQKLEGQKKESQAIIEELLQANEEMKKKLDDICRQRERDEQTQKKRDEEHAKKIAKQ